MDEKRTVKTKVGVYYIEAHTGWNSSFLKIIDHRVDLARREVTLLISKPSDIDYIRDKLNDIETAWHKELDSIQASK